MSEIPNRPSPGDLAADEGGFSLMELLVTMSLALVLLGAAGTTFKSSLDINEAAALTADSSQNLRAGTNLMIRDLLQAGRMIPTGGIPIPEGNGATAVNRPSPPGMAYTFDQTLGVMEAVTPGHDLGPVVDGLTTDMITMLMVDTSLPLDTVTPVIANDGSSVTIPVAVPLNDPATAVARGDLMLFSNALGNAIQQVTDVSGQTIQFAAGDDFNLNQRTAAAGSVTQLTSNGSFPAGTGVMRVLMITYYVDPNTTPGMPRLMRVVNRTSPRALAGVVEDLKITYDLVDGVTNPTDVPEPDDPNTPAQIRKVNLHVGVRSESVAVRTNKYMRNHVTTQVSLRSLAFVDRYR